MNTVVPFLDYNDDCKRRSSEHVHKFSIFTGKGRISLFRPILVSQRELTKTRRLFVARSAVRILHFTITIVKTMTNSFIAIRVSICHASSISLICAHRATLSCHRMRCFYPFILLEVQHQISFIHLVCYVFTFSKRAIHFVIDRKTSISKLMDVIIIFIRTVSRHPSI